MTKEINNSEIKNVEEMNFRQMIKRSSFWLYFIWAILLCAAGLAVISQAGAIAVSVKPEASAGTIATVVGLISIFNGIGRVIFGGMFDRFGRVKTMIMNEVLFCSAIIFLILSLSTGSFYILIIGFILTGLAYGGVPTTNSAFVGSFYGRKNYSINFSVLNMNLFFASFGSTIAGYLYDSSGSYFSTLFFLLGAIVVGIIIAALIKNP
jgi:OFA family oxalate/formate antiporter-like MFS transporter